MHRATLFGQQLTQFHAKQSKKNKGLVRNGKEKAIYLGRSITYTRKVDRIPSKALD